MGHIGTNKPAALHPTAHTKANDGAKGAKGKDEVSVTVTRVDSNVSDAVVAKRTSSKETSPPASSQHSGTPSAPQSRGGRWISSLFKKEAPSTTRAERAEANGVPDHVQDVFDKAIAFAAARETNSSQ